MAALPKTYLFAHRAREPFEQPYRHRIAGNTAVASNGHHVHPRHSPSRRPFAHSLFPHRHRIAETAAVVVNRYHASPSHRPSRRHFRPQPLTTPAPNRGNCCRCGKPLPRVPVSQTLQKAFSPAASYHTGTELREMLPLRLNVIVHGKRSS